MDFFIEFVKNIEKYGLEEQIKRFYSFYPAEVIDNADPLNIGRIKVKVYGLADVDTLGYWVLPITYAGANYGVFYPPEIGDIVLLLFQMGDLKKAFYFGGWWKTDDVPEEFKKTDDNGSPVVRGFKTKTGIVFYMDESEGAIQLHLKTPAGQEFIIDDTDDANKITLQNSSGAHIIIDDSKNAQNIDILSASGQEIKIDDKEQNITIMHTSGAVINIDKNGNLSISDVKNMEVKAKENITFEADKEIKFKVGKNFSIEASGDIEVKTQKGFNLQAQKDINFKSSMGQAMIDLMKNFTVKSKAGDISISGKSFKLDALTNGALSAKTGINIAGSPAPTDKIAIGIAGIKLGMALAPIAGCGPVSGNMVPTMLGPQFIIPNPAQLTKG